jgi:hypothetical protein
MRESGWHVKFWLNMLQAMTVVAMLRLLADGGSFNYFSVEMIFITRERFPMIYNFRPT